MKKKDRIIIVVFVLILLTFAVILANRLGGKIPDESSIQNSSDLTSATEGNSGDNSSADEYSESSDEDSGLDESTEDSHQSDETSAEESSEEESSEEPAESSGEETSEETSDPDDKMSKREKPAYIQREEGVKYIAFTFDDGPSVNTQELLDFIEEKQIVLTFFSVGERLESSSYGAHLTRAVSLGCEVGIHAYTHDNYYHNCSDKVYYEELYKTEELIYKYAGYYPILMRPPGGSITQDRAKNSEYNIIIWNVDSEDWKHTGRSTTEIAQQNINTIVNNVLSQVRKTSAESIVLMHDLYLNSVEAFKIIYEELANEGYQFVTVAQLCNLNASTTVGKRYYSAAYFQ